MTWEEVCADRNLRGLPYKIELNRWGKIEMSLSGHRRKEYQQAVARLLRELRPDGQAMVEPAVQTAENIKVPDAAWISFAKNGEGMSLQVPAGTAPDICVELIAPRHMREEKLHKGQLYLQAGAREFWLCDEVGGMSFFAATGPLERSALCPGFPSRVVIPDLPPPPQFSGADSSSEVSSSQPSVV